MKVGATIIELLVVIAILVILIFSSGQVFVFFQRQSSLNNTIEEIISILRVAQNKTLASEQADQYGIYFDISASPQEYTLFKGGDFASRDVSFDKIYKLPETIEIYDINLAGGDEVIFNRLTGLTDQPGNISLRIKNDNTKNQTIYVQSSGLIGLNPPSVPSNERIEDSRHVHFDYNRSIDTLSESLNLTFSYDSFFVSYEIVIADNLKDGQIYWQGEIDVNGEVQKLKIQTRRLNDPDTQFCVHRDRENNNKALKIELSGDPSGPIIEYSADGLITSYTSFYVSNLIWQ